MAGILDSDFMRFLTNNAGYWEQKDQARAAEQFQGLLGTLEQQGPSQPGQGGLLAPREPDKQFWMKAAMIPGYQQLAGQQLGYDAAGGQAMARQQQQQEYEANNLNMMQRAQIELQQRRDAFAQSIGIEDMQRKWYGTQATAGAAGASAYNSQMGAQLKQLEILKALEEQRKAQGPLIGQLKPTELATARQQIGNLDRAVSSTADVIDYITNRDPSAPLRGIGTAKGGAMAADWLLSTVPVMSQMMGTGALDDSERKFMMDLVQNPSDLHLTENQENQMKTIARKIEDFRDQTYRSYDIEPPKSRTRGAAVRAVGAQPTGQLRDYSPTPRNGLLDNPYRKR